MVNFHSRSPECNNFHKRRHPRLLGRPCQAGFAGVWFRQEKPLRFRAGPTGAATSPSGPGKSSG